MFSSHALTCEYDQSVGVIKSEGADIYTVFLYFNLNQKCISYVAFCIQLVLIQPLTHSLYVTYSSKRCILITVIQ